MTDNPFDRQIGGDHYAKLKIQPFEYSMANGLDPFQHTVIKYATRVWDKGDPLEQIDKAIHTLELYREWIQRDAPE